jgi:Spy/CpxP family protein refolding chaperone
MQSSQGPSVERQLKQLTQLLALTGDQQAQVKSILADRRQQVEALLKNSSRVKPDADSAPQPPSQEEMQSQRDAMKAIREASNSKIAALLSADQKAKFTAWQKKSVRSTEQADGEMPPPPPDGEGPPDGGGGPDGGPGGGGPGGGGPGGPPGA